MQRIIRYLPPYITTLIILIAVCYLSLASDPIPEQKIFFYFPGSDKVIHFVMYASLTAAFCFDYYRRHSHNNKERTVLALALITSIILGGVIEVLQHIMHMGRSGDLSDLAADALGAGMGIIIGIRLFARLRQDKKED